LVEYPFSLFINLFTGSETLILPPSIKWFSFGRNLVEACFAAPTEMQVAFPRGIHALQAIIFNVEEELTMGDELVRQPFNRRICKTQSKEVLEIAFPVIRDRAIDVLFDRLWWRVSVSPEFGQAILYRLGHMSKYRLARFIKEHNILEEFVRRFGLDVRNKEGIVLPFDENIRNAQVNALNLNPPIMQLAGRLCQRMKNGTGNGKTDVVGDLARWWPGRYFHTSRSF
jgi:hypothetical protein